MEVTASKKGGGGEKECGGVGGWGRVCGKARREKERKTERKKDGKRERKREEGKKERGKREEGNGRLKGGGRWLGGFGLEMYGYMEWNGMLGMWGMELGLGVSSFYKDFVCRVGRALGPFRCSLSLSFVNF